ncbi:hypothetical protein LE190_16120 [Massilia oculi]|uniref:Uncharacterized protein n=1 Tax=Massilia hydrophila TaxID=3044279 RepID=A0ABS7YCL4_9BURK|nr:hypothetical protein [Massilia oculi]MCA1857440.1 hypothetical protein [Massilia oculi]
MNLSQNPTKEQLHSIIAGANDEAGHNILWVDNTGEVRVTLLPDDITPAGWEDKFPSTSLRYETFVQGNGYVGEEAAADPAHIDRLYNSLIREWAQRSNRTGAEYIDLF